MHYNYRVVCSSYANYESHDISHKSFFFYRMLYKFLPSNYFEFYDV